MKAANAKQHFFASTAYGWAKAPTAAEAIAKLARQAGAATIKNNVKHNGGLYVWVALVDAPQDQPYAIDFFQPVGVKVIEADEFNIQNVKGHVIPVAHPVANAG